MTENAAARIAEGYAFEGAAIELGSVVIDGRADAGARVRIPLGMMNRHGLVAGATGGGKTKTLQLISEQLSAAGVPVFLADIKGDLSGVAAAGTQNDKISARATETGDDWAATAYPTQFFAIGGEGNGIPLRATITSFGPTLLSKVLELNDTQESSLELIFHYADKAGLALLDLKDLQAVITHLTSAEGKADLEGIGGLSKATAGVILRELSGLSDKGGDKFFGEPEFDTAELLQTVEGKGVINVVELAALQDRPELFSTFLMWLLADLHHELPEVGDLDKPKLAFFLDEAHLLFNGASKAFLDAVTQTVRLIRSKGVGVFFCTQNPTDLPNAVLGQLGNRVQHALRAFTPDDATALAKAVKTYPRSEDYDLEKALTTLGIGEAIVTVMSETGAPTPVAWTRLRAPRSLMAQLDPAEQTRLVQASPLAEKYGESIDRDSAYERLAKRMEKAPEPEKKAEPARRQKDSGGMIGGVLKSKAFQQFTRQAARSLGREVTRGLFGTARRR
ncbi:MAG TPA: helicase HerA-like domain-containing protein [Mycobacteriales bacterium]|nr:helicase HerA-like domain-containing protein [Mycobacteriales bacterium]